MGVTQTKRVKVSQTELDKANQSLRAGIEGSKVARFGSMVQPDPAKQPTVKFTHNEGEVESFALLHTEGKVVSISKADFMRRAKVELQQKDPGTEMRELCHVILVNNRPELVVVGGSWKEVEPILHKIQKDEEMKRGPLSTVSTHAVKVLLRRETTLKGTNESFARHLLESLALAALPRFLWAMESVASKRDEQWHKDLPYLIKASAPMLDMQKKLDLMKEEKDILREMARDNGKMVEIQEQLDNFAGKLWGSKEQKRKILAGKKRAMAARRVSQLQLRKIEGKKQARNRERRWARAAKKHGM